VVHPHHQTHQQAIVPVQGGEYFRDWITVAQAQSSFIHYEGQSSLALVYETMVYNTMKSGVWDTPLMRCEMFWKKTNWKDGIFGQIQKWETSRQNFIFIYTVCDTTEE
jgi:hypothetical protein